MLSRSAAVLATLALCTNFAAGQQTPAARLVMVVNEPITIDGHTFVPASIGRMRTAPNGDIAFNFYTSSPPGAFACVIRGGVLRLVRDQQGQPLRVDEVQGVNNSGDLLWREFPTRFTITRASGESTLVMDTNSPIPGLPGYVVDRVPDIGDQGIYVAPIGDPVAAPMPIFTRAIPPAPSIGVIMAQLTPSGITVVNGPISEQQTEIPIDTNANGQFLQSVLINQTAWLRRWDGQTMGRLLGPSDSYTTPTGQYTVGAMYSPRINDAGDVAVLSETALWFRRDGQMQPVMQFTQPGGLWQLNPNGGDRRMVLSDDGTAYFIVFPRQNTAWGRQIIAVRRNGSSYIVYGDGQRLLLPDGTPVARAPNVFVGSDNGGATNARDGLGLQFGVGIVLPSGVSVSALGILAPDETPRVVFYDNMPLVSPAGLPGTVFMSSQGDPQSFPRIAGDGTFVDVVRMRFGTSDFRNALFVSTPRPTGCSGIDFNGDGVFPSTQDVITFFNVLAGGACPTNRCRSIDFNRNGAYPEDQDVIDFLNVYAGGTCQ